MKLVTLAAPADLPRLQRLLERCSDYYELHEGWPTPADAGEFELTFMPPGRTPEGLLLLAFEDDSGALQGLVQLLRDYPQPGRWWIGLFVVVPELRGQGIGAALLRHTIDAAAADGAIAIDLAVSVHNPRAERFWQAAGFRGDGRAHSAPSRSGHVDSVHLLSRPI